jgi:hypothetical protein
MRKLKAVMFLLLAVAGLAPRGVSAQAVIDNGTVRLGINATGELNTCALDGQGVFRCMGLENVATGNDATYPGCTCEGWGVGVVGGAYSGVSASRNTSSGNTGVMLLNSFTFTASTAKSIVTIQDGFGNNVLRVTHDYHPSINSALYAVDVTITNLTGVTVGGGTDGLRYRRVMDWDIEPTPFQEYVMIDGGASSANVLFTSNDGFASADPLSGPSNIGQTGDFAWSGAYDHGALFDFGFAPLAAGSTFGFSTFYGTAPNISSMLAALGSVGTEVYSMAHCNPGSAGCTFAGDPNTFAFGFRGVGGDPVASPEPVTMTLLGTGLVGVAVARRRRRVQK